MRTFEGKSKANTQLPNCIPKERGFPGGSDGKESACNAGDQDSIPGLERFPGEGNGYTLQYSCLENSIDSPWGHKESDTTELLSLSLFILLPDSSTTLMKQLFHELF